MQDDFFIELVQDIPGASEYELRSMSSSGNFLILSCDNRFSIIRGDWRPLKEAAFVRRVSRILESSDTYESLSLPELPVGNFHVRFMDSKNCHDATIEPEIGEFLQGRGRISFRNPDFIVRAYHHGGWYVCVEVYAGNIKDFETRRAPMRPFFSPISIHPRHARFMINVSGSAPGDMVFDPFCGTGGILLEAGLMGRRVMGNDWALQMSTGAKLNLKYFGIRDYEIRNEDFLKMELREKVDAIVTDLPYGKNSKLSQKNLKQLYGESFRKFSQILRESGKCVIVVSDEAAIRESEQYFEVEQTFSYRVHRSLTRYFAILRQKT